MQSNAEEYANQLEALLPPGLAWPRSRTSTLRKLLLGLAASLARVHNRVLDLLNEADTRTTTELLTDWERVLDIPGPCDSLAATVQRRREVATQKLTTVGGSSIDYFVDLAAEFGITITITEPKPYVWQVNAPAELATFFRSGEGVAGDPLATYESGEMSCLIDLFKPAHTTVLFDFGS